MDQPHGPRSLILEPTRELAAQVDDALKTFARSTDLRIAVVYGGVGYGLQMQNLRHGLDILVATPGRLLDHLHRGTVKLDRVQYLVLDEAVGRLVGARDLSRVADLGHRTKSSARAVGAMGFSQMCQELERMRDNGTVEGARALLTRMDALLDVLSEHVAQELTVSQGS